MGFFDFLWGKDKKRESQDASAGYVPSTFGNDESDSNDSDGVADAGGGGGGGV